MTSRRGFLARAVAACFAGAGVWEKSILRAAQARASAVDGEALFELRRISSSVWLALARPAPLLNCNAVIFDLSEGLLVVDTHSKPSAAAALVSQLGRELPGRPVRYIVNTHFHYDHTQGTSIYRKPGVDLIASKVTRDLLAERGPAAIRNSIDGMKRMAESARAGLARANNDADRRFYRRGAQEAEAFVRELERYTPELPNITFDTGMTLHDKKQEVHLMFRGRAHTASDIFVFSPSQRVIATGDAAVGFIPGMGDGYPFEWPATLRSLVELPFRGVLPGHGDPQESKDRIEDMRAMLEEMNEAVMRGRQQGRTLAELQRAVTPGTLKTLAPDGYGAYIAAMTAKYRWMPPGADPWDHMADAVRSCVAAIYQKAG
ncbi:MAG: MBL fold metallo-hydrolase [Bryobacteraceae bacterium]|nr:MBL fold metallo-hydrolase [Bryobacteraceae bacterium]